MVKKRCPARPWRANALPVAIHGAFGWLHFLGILLLNAVRVYRDRYKEGCTVNAIFSCKADNTEFKFDNHHLFQLLS